MNIHTAYEQLCESEIYQQWKKEDTKSYLTSFFTMIQEGPVEDIWQIMFYHPIKERITVFGVSKDGVELLEKDAEVLKPEGKTIKELNLEEIQTELVEVLQTTERIQKEKYPQQLTEKKIIVLQSLDRPCWNITYVTRSMHVLNFKIDTETGKVLEESNAQMFSQKPQ